jgi:hypothetical protein
MSTPRPPQPAKLVVGFLLKDKTLFPALATELEDRFGPVALVSPWMPFGYTAYYETEMGAPLFRRLLAFRDMIAQDGLARIKQATNTIEQIYMVEGQRRVNIDPGYLLLARFVLATGKNYSHRIYIGEGIYAELTLVFERGAFRPLPWTYPDYADRPLRDFLQRVRGQYASDLNRVLNENPPASRGGRMTEP